MRYRGYEVHEVHMPFELLICSIASDDVLFRTNRFKMVDEWIDEQQPDPNNDDLNRLVLSQAADNAEQKRKIDQQHGTIESLERGDTLKSETIGRLTREIAALKAKPQSNVQHLNLHISTLVETNMGLQGTINTLTCELNTLKQQAERRSSKHLERLILEQIDHIEKLQGENTALKSDNAMLRKRNENQVSTINSLQGRLDSALTTLDAIKDTVDSELRAA